MTIVGMSQNMKQFLVAKKAAIKIEIKRKLYVYIVVRSNLF